MTSGRSSCDVTGGGVPTAMTVMRGDLTRHGAVPLLDPLGGACLLRLGGERARPEASRAPDSRAKGFSQGFGRPTRRLLGLAAVRFGEQASVQNHSVLWCEATATARCCGGVVPHTGFEPVISALRGRCPRPLDECGAGLCGERTGRLASDR